MLHAALRCLLALTRACRGAMENKSLNIFNSRLVLASPQTATDGDYAAIESVVAHEQFHNWTGNRVTCRDWFQLTLKEGLTVYRDQEFSADMNSRGLQRVGEVARLRAAQFPQGASLFMDISPLLVSSYARAIHSASRRRGADGAPDSAVQLHFDK